MTRDVLAPFEALHALSLKMVAAAQANDWDTLAVLEREQASLRDALRHTESAQPAEGLSPAQAERKASLLQEMLAHDIEIRRHVEPWMASARTLLGGSARGKAQDRVRAAYGAHGPKPE